MSYDELSGVSRRSYQRDLEQENAELKDKYRWRDVNVGDLPKEDVQVIVWPENKYNSKTASYNGDYFMDCECREVDVTHWMPIPEFKELDK